MGPVTRCVGKDVPPPQPFQYPLPPSPDASHQADFSKVATEIKSFIDSEDGGKESDGGALFVRLAFRCSSTFRRTDYLGGCNGARIRLAPEKDWPTNAFLDKALKLLEPIQAKYNKPDQQSHLSWVQNIC